jgi:pyruvate dehydrogenase E2 component (dihydrolipoamide acetyltransferase)
MANRQITIPDIGDSDSVEIIEILVSVGDHVGVDDSLLTLQSDKASMEIPSPAEGTITKIAVAVGDTVKEGDHIFDMEVQPASEAAPEIKKAPDKSEPAAAKQPPAPKASRSVSPPAVKTAPRPVNRQSMGAKSHASPSVRAFARKLGVEIARVVGTGPKGRIKQSDVEALIKSVMQGGGSAIPAVPVVDFSKFGETVTEPLGRIKKISGKFLHASWLNVPHVTQFEDADITEMDSYRKAHKASAAEKGLKLTPLVFVMKATVKALQEYPWFNASLSPDSQSIIKKQYYNIGVAVDTPNGLMVPVVKDVDKKDIYELSRDLMDISERARAGKLSVSDMSGGTFTISSLGGIGGTQFTPIVNAPEVAIMGLSRAKMQPVWDGSGFVPRLILPFSVSYNHRAIDGAEACRFTTAVGKHLSDLSQMVPGEGSDE